MNNALRLVTGSLIAIPVIFLLGPLAPYLAAALLVVCVFLGFFAGVVAAGLAIERRRGRRARLRQLREARVLRLGGARPGRLAAPEA